MARHVVEHGTHVEATPDEVFAWHLRPGALQRLSPPWERIEVLDPGRGVAEGSRVVLRVWGPVPVRWVALHRDVRPPDGFRDEQLEGPFPHWVHEHRFVAAPGGCHVTERIEFELPLGAAGAMAAGPVRRRVERMLRWRHEVLAGDLRAHRRAGLPPLHVAVTGARGLIGSALEPYLTTAGHRVSRLVRRPARPGEIRWDPAAERLDPAALEGVDVVVHLAGENLGARWTAARRRRIVESRIGPTAFLARTLAALPSRPRLLVSASAVGIYGDRGDETLDEGSTTGEDFLADLGRRWEHAAEPARAAGIRVVHPRTGVVLSPAGGALARMLPAFRAGVAGRLGSGRQWLSWLALDEWPGMLEHAIATPALGGAVNFVAPAPVTNAAFTETLARVLRRPALLPVPAAALRLLFGEMAEATILASQRAVPARLEATGYEFRYATLEDALRHLLGTGE